MKNLQSDGWRTEQMMKAVWIPMRPPAARAHVAAPERIAHSTPSALMRFTAPAPLTALAT